MTRTRGSRRFPFLVFLLGGGVAFLLLAIPETPPEPGSSTPGAVNGAFAWRQDTRWDSLAASYAAARSTDTGVTGRGVQLGLRHLRQLLDSLESARFFPADPIYSRIEEALFGLAPQVAARSGALQEYLHLFSLVRTAVKDQSAQWDIRARMSRETLYRILYGGRSACEEIILQAPADYLPPALLPGFDEPSASPAAALLGVRIHSGDVLVSRGGAPTSALIARGSDFPGNFSHVAVAHVDSLSGALQLIESHIERGVTVSTPGEYLRDTKLRIMVLRLRADLPPLTRDPLLPHRAAAAMLHTARARHIPYDFAMDGEDSAAMFCSEVATSAYRPFRIVLWLGRSSISSPGVRAWLADFGVRHFLTEGPSDLEYDPQLRVVAEWRDPETLRKDHIDNAVTEAMLELAEQGHRLQAPWYRLPLARLAKGLSSILNVAGMTGPVPEGMSATAALKHQDYSARHEAGVDLVERRAAEFQRVNGFEPPYWELLRIARVALTTKTYPPGEDQE